MRTLTIDLLEIDREAGTPDWQSRHQLPTTLGQVFIHSHVVAVEAINERDVPPHEGQTCSAIWWKAT